jgi:hypothetical protein
VTLVVCTGIYDVAELSPRLSAAVQVMIQLRKFAQKVQRGQQQGGDAEAEAASAPRKSRSPTSQRIGLNSDASQLLGTDMTGIDTSVGGEPDVPTMQLCKA